MIVRLHQDGRSQAVWAGQVLFEIVNASTPAVIPVSGLPIYRMPEIPPINQTPEGAVEKV